MSRTQQFSRADNRLGMLFANEAAGEGVGVDTGLPPADEAHRTAAEVFPPANVAVPMTVGGCRYGSNR